MTNYTPPTIRHRVWHPSTTFACSVALAAGLASRNQKCAPWAKRRKNSLVLHAIFLLVTRADRRRRFLCNGQRNVLSGERRQLFTHSSCAGEWARCDSTRQNQSFGISENLPISRPIKDRSIARRRLTQRKKCSEIREHHSLFFLWRPALLIDRPLDLLEPGHREVVQNDGKRQGVDALPTPSKDSQGVFVEDRR